MFSATELQSVTAPLPQAKTLPPRAYTSSEVFQAELKQIFHREWVCVAREEQLPAAGDYRSVEVIDQPLIIVRQPDMSLRAMSAICPHRAMRVVETAGNTGSFSCPYHLWKFALDGALISAPHMEGVENFPPEDCGLKPVRIESWEGFIFVNLDPDASSLTDRLILLDLITGSYGMGDMLIAASTEYDCPWNWKILVENFMEAYHHVGPHRESVQPTNNAKDSFTSGSVADGWSVLHMPDVKNKAKEEGGLPVITGLAEARQHEILASVIMPTFAWINSPTLAFWYELRPRSFNQMTLIIHTLLPRNVKEHPMADEIAQMVQASIEHIHLEDIAVNEGPWRGLQAPLTEQGPLSLLEESIWQMNQWWVKRVAG